MTLSVSIQLACFVVWLTGFVVAVALLLDRRLASPDASRLDEAFTTAVMAASWPITVTWFLVKWRRGEL